MGLEFTEFLRDCFEFLSPRGTGCYAWYSVCLAVFVLLHSPLHLLSGFVIRALQVCLRLPFLLLRCYFCVLLTIQTSFWFWSAFFLGLPLGDTKSNTLTVFSLVFVFFLLQEILYRLEILAIFLWVPIMLTGFFFGLSSVGVPSVGDTIVNCLLGVLI